MKQFTSEKQQIGEIGEKVACKYLIKQGFFIIERNYTKKIGEIDIICHKDGILHFVEVKTIVKRKSEVSRVTLDDNQSNKANVSRETGTYYPFENVTKYKLRKFSRTIEWYLVEKRVSRETPWQIDVVAVVLNYNTKIATVNVLWNVIA